MKETRDLWDMPITIELRDSFAKRADIGEIFSFFEEVDRMFNTFKSNTEISRINEKKITPARWSDDMREVISLCIRTREETKGYFDHEKDGKIYPLGMVKGWAIHRAALMLQQKGYEHFYIEAGGDLEACGMKENRPWRVGIQNPFNTKEIVKVLQVSGAGVATSGSYRRGNHIYNPHDKHEKLNEVISLTVVGPNALEADRMATAAFAMGEKGIEFIESVAGLEGYQIDRAGQATMTRGFSNYVVH